MSTFERLIHRISLWLDWVARGAMTAILLLAIANIVSTAVWAPIFGTYELIGFLTVVTLSLAIAYCTINGGHVAVDILVNRFFPGARAVFDIVRSILSVSIFLILGWQTALYATNMWQKGELSGTLMWPFYPFVYCISFGCLVTCLVLLLNLGKAVAKAVKK
jgi:TRAP-type C4-dicarboxylate transport system permease small subunit